MNVQKLYLTRQECTKLRQASLSDLVNAGFYQIGVHHEESFSPDLRQFTGYYMHDSGISMKLTYDPEDISNKHELILLDPEFNPKAKKQTFDSLKSLNINPTH